MAGAGGGSLLTAAGVASGSGSAEDQATNLQFQHLNIDAGARGITNGVGRRVTPSANSLFSHPLSDAQFGGGQNARSAVGAIENSEEEEA